MSKLSVDLTGKTALVTGASRGIGRAIAVGLAGSGATVIVNFIRNADAATETVSIIESAGGRAWSVQADVGVKADVDRMFSAARERFDGHLDILVNNAGGRAEVKPIATASESGWDRTMEINLKSVFLCSQAAVKMLPDRSGRIVNVSSISARSGASLGLSHYAAAKAGVLNFTRNCAKELAPRGITVNGIAPGVIYTDIHKHETPKDELADLERRIPLNRLGQAEDCVGAVLFLCSEAASYITGEIIEINGGLLMT